MDHGIYWMSEYTSALEAFSSVDAEFEDDVAMEASVAKQAEAVSVKYNEQISKLYADFASAYRAKDAKRANATIDETIKVISAAKAETQQIGPDKFHGLKTLIKVAAFIIGIAIIAKEKTIFVKIVNILRKFGPTAKLANLMDPMKAKSFGGVVGRSAAQLAARGSIMRAGSELAMPAITSAIQSIFTSKTGGSKAEFKKKYADDPNAKDAYYRQTITVYDAAIDAMKQIKGEIAKGDFSRNV